MKIIDRTVQLALQNDSELSQSVGSKVFRYVVPVAFEEDWPFIRVASINNIDTQYADDKATDSTIIIQVDVWDKDPDPLLPHVDRIMKSMNFKRVSAYPEYNEKKDEVRMIMRYETLTKL
ncbi:hypothetical protein J32TS2_28150 [Shouchella clausii]|uniref:hypothetical protein n=1 Tax=Shouchella clausii TaxID=79880 RepID=UPI000BA6A01F|nr:hypothetical protein [Shouchella clausii]PAD46656.1 hypothetical protein CHI09_11050 [Shouchella clausii]GIN17459.1 hypothetical protein J32TS2_28150 [Shouchella clausii]